MEIVPTCSLWGVEISAGFHALADRCRRVGYAAVEAAPAYLPDANAFYRFVRDERLEWVADVYTDGFRPEGSVAEHLASLEQQLQNYAAHGPLLVNAHSGRDRWSPAQMEDFFGSALELEQRHGIAVCHETHRGRCLATPWAAEAMLARFPRLKLTADLSHWVCVTERLLEDFAPLLARVAAQTHHLHARVGHAHGPQVSDPRSPMWAKELAAHEAWWREIIRARAAAGQSRLSVTPEFGPPPYLTVNPATGRPLADQAEICDWMAARSLTWQSGS
jgi:hypothetical protein